MYTFVCIIFALISIGIMSEMSLDYNINQKYYIPCIMVLIMCIWQIFKVIAEANRIDYNSYYNPYGEYGYKPNINRFNKHKIDKKIYAQMKNKCKRNFNIKIN